MIEAAERDVFVVRADVGTQPLNLERIYREDGPKLQRAVLLFTGDRDVADDAVAGLRARCASQE